MIITMTTTATTTKIIIKRIGSEKRNMFKIRAIVRKLQR